MARTEGVWLRDEGLISPSDDVPILLLNSYINFGGLLVGSDGYGIRDNSGVIEVKSDSGSWAAIATSVAATAWGYYAVNWSVNPVLNSAIAGGNVYDYTLNGTTRYRFVPTTYDPTQDAFYSSFVGSVLSGLIVARG